MAHEALEVDAAVARGAAAWPALAVDRMAMTAAFERAIASADDPREALAALFAEDLYLAQACALGVPGAIESFEAAHRDRLVAVFHQLGLAPDRVQELVQELRSHLFVASSDVPRIAKYSGRAPLGGWLRTVATRLAVDRLRHDDGATSSDDVVLESVTDGPELEHFRRTYHDEFKRAFESALATLDVRQRNILRHSFVDSLTIDQIGALYDVHRSTAFRWLEEARELLSKRTRANFQASLKVIPAELDSILRLVQSQLDLSLPRVLAT